MTAEEYIEEQCAEFEKKILSMGVAEKFEYSPESASMLDVLKLSLWGPEGPFEDELGPLSIMWGAAFTKIIFQAYDCQWTVDPESNVPVVVVKCGNRGMQVKAIVVATQAFRKNKPLGAMWLELEAHLTQNGAVRK